jgi:hypothetical protein
MGPANVVVRLLCARFLRGRDGQHVIIPGGDPRHDAHVASCRAAIQWRSEADLVPASVEFRIDWELLKHSPDLFKLQPPGKTLNQRENNYQALMKVLKDKQMMARFQVKKWTNWGAINVPEEWMLERFDSSRKVTRVYEGKTMSIKPLSQVTAVAVPQNAEVVDKRVRSLSRGINSVGYNISDGQILELNSPALAALTAKKASRNMHVRPPDLQQRRGLFIGAVLAILLSPLAVMMVRQARRNKQRLSPLSVTEMKQT